MITSKDNPQIKELKKLHAKSARSRSGRFAAEGEDLIVSALAAGWNPLRIFVTSDAPEELRAHAASLEVDPAVLADASLLGSGTRAIAVFERGAVGQQAVGSLALFLEGVSDPGNIGTLIRSAAAFSDSPVLLGPGCADPWSPKALRAAMGQTFHNPPIEGASLPADGREVVALDGGGSVDVADVKLDGPAVVCAGAEREGLSAQTLAGAGVVARIPMRRGGPESLNVATAAAIAMYQLAGIAQSSQKRASDAIDR